MRGEHRSGGGREPLPVGIIPACAGSTLNDLRNYTAFLSSRFGCQGTFTHQHAASAASLSPEPPRRPILARVAPSRLRHPKHRRVISPKRSLHQLDPLAVDRLPVRLKRLERKALLVLGRVHHDRPPVAHHGEHPCPKPISHPRGDVSHEHTGGYLKQPSRQIATQANWACRQHNHDHTTRLPRRPMPHIISRQQPPLPSRPKDRGDWTREQAPHRFPRTLRSAASS